MRDGNREVQLTVEAADEPDLSARFIKKGYVRQHQNSDVSRSVDFKSSRTQLVPQKQRSSNVRNAQIDLQREMVGDFDSAVMSPGIKKQLMQAKTMKEYSNVIEDSQALQFMKFSSSDMIPEGQ